MAREVVEVVARFADTVVSVAHLGPRDSYRIGNAPDVDLAIAGHASFPLVDRGVVRAPLGITTTTAGATTTVRFGHVSIAITRIKLARVRVPKRRPEWRTPLYVLGSVVAQLVVYFLAMAHEPFERLVVKPEPRLRYVHVDTPVIDPPPPKRTAQAAAAAPQQATAAITGVRPRGARREGHRELGAALAEAVARAGKIDAPWRVAQLRPEDTYDEDAANAKGFGGASRFDPDQREGFETVKAGEYVTFNFDVKLCPDQSCTANGPFPKQGVRGYLHANMAAIYDCYTQHAAGPGTIGLEFTITGDGSVRDSKGHGLGEVGPCAARVVASINFKALAGDTHVRYPIRFN